MYINVYLSKQATSGVYKVLGDKARRHPDQIVGDPFKLNIKLETGKFAYPFVSEENNLFIEKSGTNSIKRTNRSVPFNFMDLERNRTRNFSSFYKLLCELNCLKHVEANN